MKPKSFEEFISEHKEHEPLLRHTYKNKLTCVFCDVELTKENRATPDIRNDYHSNMCKEHSKYGQFFIADIVRAGLGLPLFNYPEENRQELIDHFNRCNNGKA